LVYTNVLVRNWHAWAKLGVHEIVADVDHSRVKLDYPVSLGGYRMPAIHPSRSSFT
jgi:spermidine dehydrogenase